MPTEATYRTGLQIRAFIMFLYRIIIRLLPHRLIPRLKSSSWKLAVRRPPAISTEAWNNFVDHYVGFDQWKASTEARESTIFTEAEGTMFNYITTPRIMDVYGR